MTIDYLTLAEALAIHDDQLERYGGSSEVRDHGLLEAALYRPQTGYYANLIEEAAALLHWTKAIMITRMKDVSTSWD
jgi:prophage maintenance system killer protein